MPHFLRNQMYQQLNCKEILDSLTYYKQVHDLVTCMVTCMVTCIVTCMVVSFN